MRKIFGTGGSIALAGLLLGVFALLYSTVMGSTTWYFRINGEVLVDGRPTTGYMQANAGRTILLITRTDGTNAETYLVPVAAGKPILDCGEWHPIRFFPNVVGALNSRCSATNIKPADLQDFPVTRSLVRTARSIEFLTASGKKVKAVW